MKNFSIRLFVGLFAVVFMLGGCSKNEAAQVAKVAPVKQGLEAETPEALKVFAKRILTESLLMQRITNWDLKVLQINDADLKYQTFPSVKKTINGVQYDVWPMSIEGTAITIRFNNLVPPHSTFGPKCFTKASVKVYYYLNDVNKPKYQMEDEQASFTEMK